MGASVTLPQRNPPGPELTAEMEINIMDNLTILAMANIGDVVHIGRLVTEEPRYSQVVSILNQMFPEFELLSTAQGLFALRRKNYTADRRLCCLRRDLHHYWRDDATTEIYTDFSQGRSLRTCNVIARNKGVICDDILFDHCRATSADIELCNRWLTAALLRGIDDISLKSLNDKYLSVCSKSALSTGCEQWLHALRVTSDSTLNNLIDAVLVQQSPEFKSTYMKCSYPTLDTLNISNRVPDPRECWDPNCINGNINYLLSHNYNMLSQCHVYRCNVSIGHLTMDKTSKLKMACHDNNYGNSYVNNNIVTNDNISRSLSIRIHVIFALVLIVAYTLIAAL